MPIESDFLDYGHACMHVNDVCSASCTHHRDHVHRQPHSADGMEGQEDSVYCEETQAIRIFTVPVA